MRPARTLLLVPVVALALAAAVGTASANRLGISTRNIRVVFSELEGKFRETTLMRCSVTLEGSLHGNTFAKTANALLGYVTRAVIGHPCPNFGEAYALNGTELVREATVPNTLPWHIRYERFNGTLPAITGVGVQIVGVSFLTSFLGTCLYVSTAEAPMRGLLELGAGGVVTGYRPDSTAQIPKASGGGFCPPTMGLGGLGRVTVLGTESTVRMGLI